MNDERFISSGIIELYIAGMASEEDSRELESAMVHSPEIFAEVEACRLVIERFVHLNAVNPPLDIKTHLLQHVTTSTPPDTLPLATAENIASIPLTSTTISKKKNDNSFSAS